MTESIINALVHLFAIIESAKDNTDLVDSGEIIIKPYLQKNLNNESLTKEYLASFYEYLKFYKEQSQKAKSEQLGIETTSILQIAKICNQLNKDLQTAERMIVFMQLMQLIKADENVAQKEEEFASLVALNFNLDQKDVNNLKNFILHPNKFKIGNKRLLVIDNDTKTPLIAENYRHIFSKKIEGQIKVLFIKSVEIYIFRYEGELKLFLEGAKVMPHRSYIFPTGAIIKCDNDPLVYESEITKAFLTEKSTEKVVISGDEIEFKFKNSSNGIKPFTFSEESGRLVGIMGGSGTGKSTLINLLNGKIPLQKGKLDINGHSITEASLKGVIGYVPQDDMLFEELTVFENLYYNAKVCFSDYSEEQILKTVDSLLEDLDLVETKFLRVGDVLNKTISGGQRKRLNIGLELMREPSILFVDEPTSGLSSMDSEKMMLLLKDLARRKGKLVIAILHQPSSDIFKMLDNLWILDKGGYPIYNGNPIDAVVYFKTMSTQVNAAESECPRCGNVIPDQILQIIESREINESGNTTRVRRVKPHEWYEKYKENIHPSIHKIRHKTNLPPTDFSIPNVFSQFKIFSKRNLKSKLANKQYMFITLLEAPFLAFILGYFSKYSPQKNYSFTDNINLPTYLFMAIVVALFMGLIVSAQEIYKDRKILERESFLNLSRTSYLNSKIVYLFGISAVQTLLFVLVGNFILEIRGMELYHWGILFTCSCFANMVGLNISSAFNSIINIYILIPFILVPQLLLGGAMIKFDELHHSISNQKNVPFVGDLMASRWAYEAITVAQYKYNKYDRHFFDINSEISKNSTTKSFIIPELSKINKEIKSGQTDWRKQKKEFLILQNELKKINKKSKGQLELFSKIDQLNPDDFNANLADSLEIYLQNAKNFFGEKYKIARRKKDHIYQKLSRNLGKNTFDKMQMHYHNKRTESLLMNRTQTKMVYRGKSELIQKKDPIFLINHSMLGRSHFYAAEKEIFNQIIPTYFFNLTVIWLMSFILYITLKHETLKKLIDFTERKYPLLLKKLGIKRLKSLTPKK